MKKKLGIMLALALLVPSVALAVDAGNIKIGGEVRMRGYEFNNFWTFDDNSPNWGKYYGPTASDYYAPVKDRWSTFRLYTSLNATADVGDNVTAYVRLSNQTYGEGVGTGDNVDNKVFVENAFIDAKNFWTIPLSLRVGRQNLMYGSGFVLFDGQSQFASTSMYFDGVKATLNFTDNIFLDAFYMIDQENDRDNQPGDDIYLYGAYLTAKDWSIIGGTQEIYAMSRKDQDLDMDIKMFGIRLSDKIDLGLDYSIEAAKQMGNAWNGEDQDAWGGKAEVGYTLTALEIKPRIFGQYAYMSGDDESTDDWEGWNVFYGGWPQFGDLLAWKFVNVPFNNNADYDELWAEGTIAGEAAYSNLRIITVGASFVFGPVTPSFSFSTIQLDETYEFWGITEDDDFGDYYQANLNYQYNKALSFGMYYAVLKPGDAFVGNDDAYEFYWEARLKF